MEKLTISYHDTQTDEVIVREMTVEEVAQHNAIIVERNEFHQQQSQIATDKAALLAKLGITAEEAQLLLGGK